MKYQFMVSGQVIHEASDFGGFLASSDRACFLPWREAEYRNFFHFGRSAPTPASQPFESHHVFNDLQSELRRLTEAELLVYQATLISQNLLYNIRACLPIGPSPRSLSGSRVRKGPWDGLQQY